MRALGPVLLVLALAGLLPAAASAQEVPLTVWVDDRGLGEGSIKVFRDGPEFRPVRVRVLRDGETIADAVGGDSFFDRETDFLLDPLPGDVIAIHDPPADPEPRFAYAYDGRPALGPCPAGARSVDARLLPGAETSARVDGTDPPGLETPEVVLGPFATATLRLGRPLAPTALVTVRGQRVLDGVDLAVSTTRRAGACAGPVVPPPPSVADGRVFPTRASTLVTRRDVRRGHVLVVGMGCDRASRVPCRGTVRLQTVPARPGEAAVEVGRERVSIPAGISSSASIVLGDRVQALLSAGRETRIRARWDLHDTVGRLVTRTRSYRVVGGPSPY